jgi:GTPase SAR1 family protein
MQKIELTGDEIRSIQKRIETVHLVTRLNFLKQHKGLKPGKIHLVLGTAGGGKSTLRNTLIMDYLKNNPEKIVYLHLSEESISDFKTDLVDNPYMIPFLERIFISSEQDDPVEDRAFEFTELMENVIKSQAGLFIFDNITTSDFYGETPSEQSSASKKMKQLLGALGCATVLMAHTDSTVKLSNKRMIDQMEVRGSKKIVNLAEFLYILQTFFEHGITYTILRITKHRASNVDEKIFRLHFDKTTRTYTKDSVIEPDTYLKFFKENKANKKYSQHKS